MRNGTVIAVVASLAIVNAPAAQAPPDRLPPMTTLEQLRPPLTAEQKIRIFSAGLQDELNSLAADQAGRPAASIAIARAGAEVAQAVNAALEAAGPANPPN